MGGRNGTAQHAPRSGGRGGSPVGAPLRSVALLGPPGSGKTTLLEHLLVTSGAIPRAGVVADGTSVGDHDLAARHLGRSVSLTVASLHHRGVKIGLVDTPGCPDFLGEVRAGLHAADAALLVVDATDVTDAAQAATESTAEPAGVRLAQALPSWRECRDAGMPVIVVLARSDQPRADAALAPAGLAAALDPAGTTAFVVTHRRDGDGALADVLDESVETLIERSEDEALLERWIGGEQPSAAELRADLGRASATGEIVPVVPVAAVARQGLDALLDLLVDVLPAPAARPPLAVHDRTGGPGDPLRVDPQGPLVAEVLHTGLDAQGGRVSTLRVFSGTLRPDSVLSVLPAPRAVTDDLADVPAPRRSPEVSTVRVGRLHAPLGGVLRELDACPAGDLCAVTRLADAVTGDTLVAADDPAAPGVDPWEPPAAQLPVAVAVGGSGSSAADLLARGLARLADLEPGLRIDRNAETHQVVLWCTGDRHADVVLDRLRAAGAPVEICDVVVPRRETVAGPARAVGRHVKQSGGHGQYAVCHVEIEPLPAGSGVEFVDRIVGGVIPRAYIPGVEKGVRDQLAAGVHDGRPVVDLRVTLVDGKSHSVDSSEQAFQTAGALAIREAVAASGTVVLEPLDEVEVVVDDDRLGAVLGDLASRHGRVQGTEPAGTGLTKVSAEVPESALLRYPVDLGVLTGGTARFTRRFGRYDRAATADSGTVAGEP